MSHVPMMFQFPNYNAAALAYDTMTEIGYHCHVGEQGGKSVVQVFVDHSELTSALEIAQAHGGDLLPADGSEGKFAERIPHAGEERTVPVEQGWRGATEGQLYETAYGMDMVPIPAHLVNEDAETDWPEAAPALASSEERGKETSADDGFDPSGDDYDGFDAGIHL